MTQVLPRQKLEREFALDPSLVLYLPLYELDGAAFSSKEYYGHPCTVNGALWRPDGHSFDGVDDRVVVPDCAALSALTAMTIMVWMKSDTHVSQACLASKYWHATQREWYLAATGVANPSSPIFTIYDQAANASLAITPTAIIDLFTNDWYCVMGYWGGSVDGSGMGMTINGVEVPVTLTLVNVFANINNGTQDVLIGEIGNLARDYIGLIGEFAQWNRKLGAPERQNAYLATKWRYQ